MAANPQNRLASLNYPTETTQQVKREYRNRGLGNVLRMFHCAPTVMKTVLDAANSDEDWLIKLTAGMPGGIGNTGNECGAYTSPLILLGLRYSLETNGDGLPIIFHKGSYLKDEFISCNKTLLCKEIQGKARVPIQCIGVVRHSPELLADAISSDCENALPEEKREAFTRLYTHLTENSFHCARAVFQNLSDVIPPSKELSEAASGFMGGTLFLGRTCSAFTAGVMAIGLQIGEIEWSFPRVFKMIAIMAMGKNAFTDDLNKFHRVMNTGYRLSRWFKKEYGSTQCLAITGCDFSTPDGVQKYMDDRCVSRCRWIAEQVAEKVREVLRENIAEPVLAPQT